MLGSGTKYTLGGLNSLKNTVLSFWHPHGEAVEHSGSKHEKVLFVLLYYFPFINDRPLLYGSTYKSGEVIVNAVCCKPLAEVPLFVQELFSHFSHFLTCALLVVASDSWLRGFSKGPLGANKQLLMAFFWWNYMTFKIKKITKGGMRSRLKIIFGRCYQ